MNSVLFVDHAAAIGGAETSLLLLLERLDRDLCTPQLMCPEGPLARRATALGVEVRTLPMPSLRMFSTLSGEALRTANSLAREARRINAELMYANTARAALYASVACRFCRLPLVWHMRDFHFLEPGAQGYWMDRILKLLVAASANQIVANSRAVAACLPGSQRVVVVHNGIDLTRIDRSEDGTAFRKRLGVAAEAPLVGMVGRLRPWKGQETFLRTAAMVRRTLPAARFVVIGGDPFEVRDGYVERLQLLVRQLEVDDCTYFTGHLNDVGEALAAIDVFVHPGAPEPFGLVNIEAMARGKPVVAFAHGALPEIVVEGVTGLLVPPADEGALSEAITSLLCDPDLRHRLGRGGRERVEAEFSIERTVRGVETVLARVLR